VAGTVERPDRSIAKPRTEEGPDHAPVRNDGGRRRRLALMTPQPGRPSLSRARQLWKNNAVRPACCVPDFPYVNVRGNCRCTTFTSCRCKPAGS
jgi:hypothetical protein